MQIAILIYEGLTALDAIGPYEVLSQLPNSEVIFVAREAGAITTDTKFLTLIAERAIGDVSSPDIVVIPGGTLGTNTAAHDTTILDWIQKVHQTTRWTTSVCTGSLILGAAGLLKDLQATTHWCAKNGLSKYGATYVPERFVEQGKIITAAGVSAGIDMALHLVSKIAGENLAAAIELILEYDPKPQFNTGSFSKAPAPLSQKISHRLMGQLKQELKEDFNTSIFADCDG